MRFKISYKVYRAPSTSVVVIAVFPVAQHKLQAAGLKANLEKCEFWKKKTEFFELIFSGEGVSPNPTEVADFHRAAEPKNASEVRSLLGMAHYTVRHIKDFATITEPLRALTKQGNDWQWGMKSPTQLKHYLRSHRQPSLEPFNTA